MKRQRSATIIIQDKKILLVRDGLASFFSMPGGAIEDGEDRLSALRGEVEEEIGVSLVSADYYFSFDLVNQVFSVPQTDHTFMTHIADTPVCGNEICEIGWFSKDDILANKVEVPVAFFELLMPKLISDNYL